MTNNFRRLHGIPMRTKKGYKVKIEKEKKEFLLWEKDLGIKYEQLIFPWRGGRRFRKSHKKGIWLSMLKLPS